MNSQTNKDPQCIYAIDGLPTLQNRVYETAQQAIACRRGKVSLSHHPDTWIVSNLAFKDHLVCYDSFYNNEQSHSPTFKQHLNDVASLIKHRLGSKNLFEVGCGKGAFLEQLKGEGCEIGGCDPTYEGTNPSVVKSFFNESLGIAGKNLILRHVLEHIVNPLDFLHYLARANQGGKIYIEVPCLDWIIANRAWFDIFYEHVNYFRQSDFDRMFKSAEVKKLFGGQYLGVVADLDKLRAHEEVKALGKGAARIEFPNDFHTPEIRDAAQDDVIWGAASKGVIYAIMREKLGIPLAFAIDMNPAKQGRYLPVTGIPIISPATYMRIGTAKQQIFIMNSNYSNEIKSLTNNRFCYRVLGTNEEKGGVK